MHVIDADFEQPDIKTGRRRIWHTIGCHSCGNQVLDSISFGAGKTGYSLLQEARAQVTEYILEVNGGHFAEIYEISFRAMAAAEIRDIWDKYYPEPLGDRNCASLLLLKSELRMISDSIRLVLEGYDRLPRGGTAPEMAWSSIVGDAGRTSLNSFADELITLARNKRATGNPRTIRGGSYHLVSLPTYLVHLVTRCIAYATGNPDQLARYLYASYRDKVADGKCEADFVSHYVAAHGYLRHFPGMTMRSLAHYYRHVCARG